VEMAKAYDVIVGKIRMAAKFCQALWPGGQKNFIRILNEIANKFWCVGSSKCSLEVISKPNF
jgi:hypothetical protein